MALQRFVHVTQSQTSLVSRIVSGARGLTQGSVKRITLRSNFTPDVDYSWAESQAGARKGDFSELFWRLAKPEIEVETSFGTIRSAPYGEPDMNLFWPAAILGVASVGALGILAWRGLFR